MTNFPEEVFHFFDQPNWTLHGNLGKQKYDRLNSIFRISTSAIVSLSERKWVTSLQLNNLDDDTKEHLKTKAREAIISPQDTDLFNLLQSSESSDNKAWLYENLKQIETDGLLVLGLLGELDDLPQLIKNIAHQKESFDSKTLRDFEFVLHFLVGHYFSQTTITNWEKLWRHNKPALERVSLQTRLQLDDIAYWLIILEKDKRKVEALNAYAKQNQNASLILDDMIWDLWNELEKEVPYLQFERLWTYPPLNHEVTLYHWISNLDQSFLLGHPKAAFVPPLEYREIKIRSDISPLWLEPLMQLLPYVNRFNQLQSYWQHLFSLWESWRLSSGADLNSIEWHIEAETVEIVTGWAMPIRSVKPLTLEKNEDTFWKINFQEEQPPYIPTISNAYLLNMQLLAKRDGNKFIPISVNNEQLKLALQIPKTKSSLSSPSSNPLPKGEIEQVVYHILASILPDYVESSRQLEDILSKEKNRIKPLIAPFDVPGSSLDSPAFENIEQELFYGMQEATGEIIWLRETLTKHLGNLRLFMLNTQIEP